MTPWDRATNAYHAIDVPLPTSIITVVIWFLVGFPIWQHFTSFDLPSNYPFLIAWIAGGFAATFFYILFACD